jgi:cold-inducible RNA-binding protein
VPGHASWFPASSREPQIFGHQASKVQHVSKKLYVGNLSFDVTQEQLQELFAPYGTVRSSQLISDRATGRSKGFGFVEMSSDKEAESAIGGMNGQMVDGRALTVNEAKPKEERPRTGGGYGSYR